MLMILHKIQQNLKFTPHKDNEEFQSLGTKVNMYDISDVFYK